MRSAKAVATEKSIFLVLSRVNFESFLSVAPFVRQAIQLHTKERLARIYRELQVPRGSRVATL